MSVLRATALAALLLPTLLLSAEPLQLEWSGLIPPNLDNPLATPRAVTGIVQHEQIDTLDTTRSAEVVHGLDGKQVQLPGFVVPLDFDGSDVREFLLVPYVGACVHVPPPPPNQIVYVISQNGFQISGLFEAVVVTGMMTVDLADTGLAEVGYQIEASQVDKFPLH